jgi:hypothetical protein
MNKGNFFIPTYFIFGAEWTRRRHTTRIRDFFSFVNENNLRNLVERASEKYLLL